MVQAIWLLFYYTNLKVGKSLNPSMHLRPIRFCHTHLQKWNLNYFCCFQEEELASSRGGSTCMERHRAPPITKPPRTGWPQHVWALELKQWGHVGACRGEGAADVPILSAMGMCCVAHAWTGHVLSCKSQPCRWLTCMVQPAAGHKQLIALPLTLISKRVLDVCWSTGKVKI